MSSFILETLFVLCMSSSSTSWEILIFYVLLGIWILLLFFFFFLNKYWGKRPKSDKETLNLAPSKKLSLIFPVLLTFLSHVGAERHMEALRKE